MPSDPRAHIVYFHGNGGNLSIWAPILAGVARQGYSVVAFDYRGYGNSTGRPTERGLYRDADAILRHFWSGPAKDKPVVYWGRSLGGAVAAYAATVRAPDRLILESAFPDVQAVVGRSLPLALLLPFSTYRFPAAAFLQKIVAPVLVMHGDRDGVIPFALGRALFEGIPGTEAIRDDSRRRSQRRGAAQSQCLLDGGRDIHRRSMNTDPRLGVRYAGVSTCGFRAGAGGVSRLPR